MIGMIFTIPLFPTLIFPAIGIPLWIKGIRDAKAELIPLEHGAHVEGEITAIEYDYTKTINNRHPKELQFSFKANGQQHIGTVPNIFDPIELWKKPGDKIWVVYMRDNPELSSVWPPIK